MNGILLDGAIVDCESTGQFYASWGENFREEGGGNVDPYCEPRLGELGQREAKGTNRKIIFHEGAAIVSHREQ